MRALYEYKFIQVPAARGVAVKPGDTFAACKEVIAKAALEGWRLVQVVTPINEKTGVFSPNCYEIILERETP